MGEWEPMFYALIGLFIIAGIIPFFLTGFVDVEDVNINNTVLNNTINFIEDGTNITIPIPIFPDIVIPFNIFSYVSEGVKDFIVTELTYLSLIPNWILYPFIVLFLLGLIYSIIKLLPTT
jgi:hypothetical protein